MTAIAQETQPVRALQRANEIRLARAAAMRRVRALSRDEGLLVVAELVERSPAWLATMRVEQLLLNIRRLGPRLGTFPLLRHAGIPPTSRVGSLSARQRAALSAGMRDMAAGRSLPRQVPKPPPRSSGIPGVGWCSRYGLWQVKVWHDGAEHWLGRYPTVREAQAVIEDFRREHPRRRKA